MSDTSQGPGWWQASDGRWYAPELHPTASQHQVKPQSVKPSQEWYRLTWVIVVALVVFFPVGLVLMWMSGWKMPTKLIVTGALAALVIVSIATSSPTPKPTHLAVATVHSQATTTTLPKPKPVTTTTRPQPKPTPTTTTPTTVPPTTPPTTSPPTTAPPSQAQIVQQFESSAQAATVSQLANDPSNYDGLVVSFTATISNFLQDSSGDTTAMNVSDPNDPSSVVYVQLSNTADVTQMNKGDTVVIWGDGQGSISGKNDFGGTVNEGAVTETYLTDQTSSYSDNSDSSPS